MAKGKFAAVTRAKLIEVRERFSQIQPRYGGDPIEVAADTVVFVPNNKSNRQLADELTSFPGHVVVVGDALSPRFLQTAIREGHLAARSLATLSKGRADTERFADSQGPGVSRNVEPVLVPTV
jgi:hypothetical protein